MEQNSKPSPFRTPLAEVLIVLVLAFLVIISLNYFGIISLSLPFLPNQATKTTNQTQQINKLNQKNFTVKEVVSPLSPLVINNTSQQTIVKPLDNGSVETGTGQMRIDLEVGLTTGLTTASGFVLTSNTDPTKRVLFIYDPVGKQWKLSYYHNQDLVKEVVVFKYSENSLIYGKFSLLVSADGKSARASFLPLNKLATLNLPESIYGKDTKQLNTTLQVAPGSKLEIRNFSYETFQ